MGDKKLTGSRVRAARVARRKTQREVGGWVGMSDKTVCLLEAGERTLSAADAYVLAREFGVTIGYLLGEGEDEPPPGRDPILVGCVCPNRLAA
jgi:transcriptional regulator with XRE-family HTH domain